MKFKNEFAQHVSYTLFPMISENYSWLYGKLFSARIKNEDKKCISEEMTDEIRKIVNEYIDGQHATLMKMISQ